MPKFERCCRCDDPTGNYARVVDETVYYLCSKCNKELIKLLAVITINFMEGDRTPVAKKSVAKTAAAVLIKKPIKGVKKVI